MRITEWLKRKVLNTLGMQKFETNPQELSERLTFVNDTEEMIKQRIREYCRWYEGDSDALLDFYTRSNAINFYYEPFYTRNKKNYFWSISSTEGDIKRVHSGQPRNIVDTITAIMGTPDVKGGNPEMDENNLVDKNLQKIIKENKFWKMYRQKQLPLTLVEGWGCYRIDWDMDISEEPIVVYFRAENVEFIKKKGQIIGIIFKEYYVDGKKTYMITETRKKHKGSLIIEKEAFDVTGDGEEVRKVEFKEIPCFAECDEEEFATLEIPDFNMLLAVPCVFYEDTTGDMEGRSIFTGKIDLFDELDQCLSQASSSVRKSTPVEYIDVNFLERDVKTGVPIQPKAYDRKFIMYNGAKSVDGSPLNATPAIVTQPQLNISQYNDTALNILLQIVNGILSPATLGIDISKRDNAEAQREKEKITIFTRNWLAGIEKEILEDLFSQLLVAKEYIKHGKITTREYNVSVTYPEFADESYEAKLEILGAALGNGGISVDMYLKKLYSGKLNKSEYAREKKYIEEMLQGGNEPSAFGAEEIGMPPGAGGTEGEEIPPEIAAMLG